MSNKQNQSSGNKFDYGKPLCVRCHNPLFNEFRSEPWCHDCDLELQQMSFNGVEVLEMVTKMMPPMPPHPDAPVRAMTVIRLCRTILIDNNVLLPADNEDDRGAPAPKSPILTR